MKKLLSCAICLIFISNVFGQEKFTIPERTPEQKHQTTMFQYHAMVAAGIHFAKSQGISPYEYGKYVGDLVAQTWNNENGFDRYVNITIFSLENFRTDADIPLEIIEKDDSSVIIKFSAEISGKYYPEGNPSASFNDVLHFWQGMHERFADKLGCSFKHESTEDLIIFTITKK